MANPQKENGFTPIANEILERLVNTALLGSEFQVLLFIIRKTYGYHKKKDRISLTQFEKGTGLSRPTVVKTLKNLMSRNMIIKIVLPNDNVEYTFVKDHEDWVVNTALLVKHNEFGSKPVLTETSKPVLTHKRKKDNTKDNTAELVSADINLLLESFSKINPTIKKMYGNTTQRKACNFLISEYGLERTQTIVEKTLPKTNGLQFFPTITTPVQLQDKWVALESAVRKYQAEKQTTINKNKVAF